MVQRNRIEGIYGCRRLAKYYYVTKSWMVMRTGHVAHVVEKRNAYRDLAGNPERKKALGRSRHRWEDKSVLCSFKLCHHPYRSLHIKFITRQLRYSSTL